MKKLAIVKPDSDIRFEEVPYQCKCGYKGKDTILVSQNTGILDVNCPKCGRRILEFRILENNEGK
ncbi:hypothetical protein [Hydrogenothermus marinus]|uniref:Uncharacterized protein n=1 Tax=Hydrogenothermus marinus TaxID=133270 RepID=A0A3M0BL98_9AQUI|nr:hypothetical protein [Hydrogenothermus marinus]RMA97214.1 hypothetical protein CLV39_0870 [Hydrogenothermus marinus]